MKVFVKDDEAVGLHDRGSGDFIFLKVLFVVAEEPAADVDGVAVSVVELYPVGGLCV